ncbi:MAG TPA: 4Fe-4S binding protein [Clostridia bacterium]|nr:4Fe-4S binding protein [Clostridia bacterium]
MLRKIITIDEEKCTGCGLCINACHEGALKLVDGKARLISDSYCDGLGNCLPECPTGAITIEDREADSYDEEAVLKHLQDEAGVDPEMLDKLIQNTAHPDIPMPSGCMGEQMTQSSTSPGCPGSRARVISRSMVNSPKAESDKNEAGTAYARAESQLGQWPCQIKLVPVGAPYFDNAHLLIAADCTAYAYANIHRDFMRNKITLIGCPKLDEIDYTEKLAAILANHNIKSVTVLRMEVPCCGGIANAVRNAFMNSGKMIPWNIVTIGTDGNILED